MMQHFIYRCEVTESYWSIDTQSSTCSDRHVRMYGASVYSMSTLLNLATSEDFTLWKQDVDKIVEDYRLKNDDKTDTWDGGATSWSTDDENQISWWTYAKLSED